MGNSLRKFFVASVTAALVLTPAAAIVTIASADAVYAKNGHGGGNSGGNNSRGGENAGSRGKPDHAGNRNNGRNAGRATGRNGRGPFGILRGNSSRTGSAMRERTNIVRSGTKRRVPVTKAVKVSPVPKVRPDRVRAPAVQSELKWLNAANASLNAYANASPNSRVGQIAAYREALLDHQNAANDPEYIEEIESYITAMGEFAAEGTTDAELEAALAEIQALDSSGEVVDPVTLGEILTGLNPDATEEEIAELSADLEAAIASDNEIADLAAERDLALDTAADGIVLEPGSEAWDHFHELLRLDDELPQPSGQRSAEDPVEGEPEAATEEGAVLLVAD